MRLRTLNRGVAIAMSLMVLTFLLLQPIIDFTLFMQATLLAFSHLNITLQYLIMTPIALAIGFILIYSRFNEPSVYNDEDIFIKTFKDYVIDNKRCLADHIMLAIRYIGAASLVLGVFMISSLLVLVPLQIIGTFGHTLGVTIIGWIIWLITTTTAVAVYFGKEHIRSVLYSLLTRLNPRECYYGQIIDLDNTHTLKGRIARVGIFFARIYTAGEVEYRDILVSQLYDSGLGYTCSTSIRIRPTNEA